MELYRKELLSLNYEYGNYAYRGTADDVNWPRSSMPTIALSIVQTPRLCLLAISAEAKPQSTILNIPTRKLCSTQRSTPSHKHQAPKIVVSWQENVLAPNVAVWKRAPRPKLYRLLSFEVGKLLSCHAVTRAKSMGLTYISKSQWVCKHNRWGLLPDVLSLTELGQQPHQKGWTANLTFRIRRMPQDKAILSVVHPRPVTLP